MAPHSDTMFTDLVLSGDAYYICIQSISMLPLAHPELYQKNCRHVQGFEACLGGFTAS